MRFFCPKVFITSRLALKGLLETHLNFHMKESKRIIYTYNTMKP